MSGGWNGWLVELTGRWGRRVLKEEAKGGKGAGGSEGLSGKVGVSR